MSAAHIIVVDDEAPAREMVGDYLRMHGFDVTLCDGGKALRAAIAQHAPDLIVLDLNMPEVNGFDVVSALQEQPATARIPVLIVTSKTLTPEDLGKLNGFVSTVLEKGDFNGDQFASEVRRAVSGRQAAR